MSNLLLAAAASGILRNAHFVVPNGRTIPERTLLIEPASVNRVLYSQDLANAAWSKSLVAVTSDALAAPDGTLTADLAVLDGGAPSTLQQTVTLVGDGTKAISAFVHPQRNPYFGFQLQDTTAAAVRQLVAWQFNGDNIPTLAAIDTTAADAFTPQRVKGTNWWRVAAKAPGVIAANTNVLTIYPAYAGSATGDGTYPWGIQVEDRPVPTAYIPTTSVVVGRNEESPYLPFSAHPQPMTIYLRFIDLGVGIDGLSNYSGLFAIGGTTDDAMWVVNDTANRLVVSHRRTSEVLGSYAATRTAYGDLVEIRVTLAADGVVQLHQTINGGAEESGTASSAQPLAAAWSNPRFYIGNRNGAVGSAAFTHVAIAKGAQSRETMRQLAGVLAP